MRYFAYQTSDLTLNAPAVVGERGFLCLAFRIQPPRHLLCFAFVLLRPIFGLGVDSPS